MLKGEQVKVVEFDARLSEAKQDATIQKLRKEGWSVRSVELGPDGRKKLHLVRVRPEPAKDS